jgi:hypothetical protein
MMRMTAQCLYHVGIVTVMVLSTSGCLSTKLLRMDIEQRQAQLVELDDTSAFLAPKPTLGSEYDGRVFLSEKALNAFLAGFDKYSIPLESPKKASILLERAALSFEDGAAEVVVDAKGLREGWPIELKLRVHAQLIIVPEPARRRLQIKLRVLRVLPEVKLSIFRLREFYLAQRFMRLKAEEYVDALPVTEVALEPDLRIDVKGTNYFVIETNSKRGWIRVKVDNPAVSLKYEYTVFRAVPLDDGLHLFLRVGETPL